MHKNLAAAFAAAAAVAFSLPAFAAADADFLGKAIQGDNSEIALGRLAAERGGSAAVRDFGRTLERDHTDGKTQALAVARAANVTPPDGMTPEAQAEQTKLQSLKGADFDREFAAYMVQDHQQDIKDFTNEAYKHDGATSALASKTLPVLKKHLRMAETLQRQG
ncbi:MAG: DUF4142 domain-containing protein [Caulobacteraceae bacterium]|nr:DUF4142 domain-containing protein [Caulobacteraceae bacterium]